MGEATMRRVDVPSTVVMALLDEPPFCWLAADGTALGSDVEVARLALGVIGVTDIQFRLVPFPDLIPGLRTGEWQLTTRMFVTAERRRSVRFTRPIWSVADGLIVRADARRLTSYAAVAADPEARVAVVRAQVQRQRARAEGIPENRILEVETQEEAAQAVLHRRAAAAASTAIGNRALLARMNDHRLVAADLDPRAGPGEASSFGAFALGLGHEPLAKAPDVALERELGTHRHRRIMRRHGFRDEEYASA